MRSADADDISPTGLGSMGGANHVNSNQNLNADFAGFHGTANSGTGSQDSKIGTIENPYSRANKFRKMGRPPTQSG